MAKRRNFTPEFKVEVVVETLCDESSQNAAPLFEPIDKQPHASQQRITQLEQLVGVNLGIGHFIEFKKEHLS